MQRLLALTRPFGSREPDEDVAITLDKNAAVVSRRWQSDLAH